MSEEKKITNPHDPAGLFESAFLLGIGVLELTREKTQDLADDLIERGKLSQSDAKKVADRIGSMVEEQQSNIRKAVVQETDRWIKSGGMATKSEVDALHTEIAELKAMISSLMPEASSPTDDPS